MEINRQLKHRCRLWWHASKQLNSALSCLAGGSSLHLAFAVSVAFLGALDAALELSGHRSFGFTMSETTATYSYYCVESVFQTGWLREYQSALSEINIIIVWSSVINRVDLNDLYIYKSWGSWREEQNLRAHFEVSWCHECCCLSRVDVCRISIAGLASL